MSNYPVFVKNDESELSELASYIATGVSSPPSSYNSTQVSTYVTAAKCEINYTPPHSVEVEERLEKSRKQVPSSMGTLLVDACFNYSEGEKRNA